MLENLINLIFEKKLIVKNYMLSRKKEQSINVVRCFWYSIYQNALKHKYALDNLKQNYGKIVENCHDCEGIDRNKRCYYRK